MMRDLKEVDGPNKVYRANQLLLNVPRKISGTEETKLAILEKENDACGVFTMVLVEFGAMRGTLLFSTKGGWGRRSFIR